jgi:hypothetical protein
MAFAFTFTVASQALAYDTFINTTNHKEVYLDGVPDFDQRRMNIEVTLSGSDYPVLGLAGNGSEYCVTTSATDWCSFLANRGYPNLAPGPGNLSGDWSSGVTGLGQYNLVDLCIAIMGADMQTSATNGTYGGPAQTGCQQYLDASYYGKFVTVNIEADSSGFPMIKDLLNAELNGNLIVPYGGWYQTTTYNNQTYYYRNGGHATAMAYANWTGGDAVTLGLCNPWTNDDMTLQSAFTYTPYTTSHQLVGLTGVDSNGNAKAGTQSDYTVDFLDTSSNWILDGALEIQPLCGYTKKRNWWATLLPYQFVNFLGVAESYVQGQSMDGGNINSIARSPLTGLLYYATDRGAYCVDPSNQTQYRLPVQYRIQSIMFGSGFKPYVLYNGGSVAMLDPQTGFLSHSIWIGDVDSLSFDPGRNQIIAFNSRTGRYILLDHNLNRNSPTSNFPFEPTGEGPITLQVGPGSHMFAFQTGDPVLYQFDPINPSGQPGATPHFLPAVQFADSFSIDDIGNLYFSIDGSVLALDGKGRQMDSPFNGLPGGDQVFLSRSVSNYDPSIHGTWQWRNVPPHQQYNQYNVARP